MKYVLINPVVDSMYERSQLDALLGKNGYQRAEVQVSWGPIVKDKYEKLLKSGDATVVDVRCPVAAQNVKDKYQKEGLLIPDIEPILLHCAREVSEREEIKEFEKVITTPCKALADMGNALELKNTTFMAWNEFEKTLGETLDAKSLEASPIPPGFFADLEETNQSITGEKEIEEYFEAGLWKKTRLVELLHCPSGCHNGDGVAVYE